MMVDYKVLQVNEQNEERLKFFGIHALEKIVGISSVDPNAWSIVYESTEDFGEYKDIETMLEILYAKFNLNRPDDFKGHSVSVSDVIMVNADDEWQTYFCDSFGWVQLHTTSSGMWAWSRANA